MKTRSLLLFLIAFSFQAFAQSPAKGLEGAWSGLLDAGGTKLRLLVTVTKSESGTYTGKFESLDQGATVPIDSIDLDGDNARFEVKAAGIVFEGVLNKDRTEWAGKFMQGGQTIPLTFTRGEPAASSAKKPAPKPDYSAPPDAPYTAEDVQVKTPMGHVLAGTLTLPKSASGEKPSPAIVIITGSGRQNRDGELGFEGYRPFRQIADSLARRGIAMLRMDDRGTGESGGEFKGATSADFAEDIRAGLAYLRGRSEINAGRLGVLGHSEGALIAPMVAEKEAGLRAIVLLAGVAEPARSALHFQMKNIYDHDTSLTPEKREELIKAIPQRIDAMMEADPWMKFFVTYDPAATMRKVKTPVLILTGSNDKQAVPEQVVLMKAAFKAGGNEDVTAKVLPGLNHLFVEDADGFAGNYKNLPPPVAIRSDVLEIIADWLAKRLR
ncbi:MAG: alpha/beta fold hydrolase [Acidobacteriota bacterium]|nr:MAG: alpha/beta fold hydrolase [Acidobacteriota bacterium]